MFVLNPPLAERAEGGEKMEKWMDDGFVWPSTGSTRNE